MTNQEIRDEIAKSRLFHWEVAKKIGIHPVTFSCKLRYELTEENKQKIRKAIAELLNQDR